MRGSLSLSLGVLLITLPWHCLSGRNLLPFPLFHRSLPISSSSLSLSYALNKIRNPNRTKNQVADRNSDKKPFPDLTLRGGKAPRGYSNNNFQKIQQIFLSSALAPLLSSSSSSLSRISTSILLAAGLIPILFAGKVSVSLLIGVAVLLAQKEFHHVIQQIKGLNSVEFPISAISSLMLVFAACLRPALQPFLLYLSPLLIMTNVLLSGQRIASTADVASSSFGVVYVGYFMSHWIRIMDIKNIKFTALRKYQLGPFTVNDSSMLLLWTACMVAFSDMGGYVFGRLFGRHLLSEIGFAGGILSPRKTIEGLFGGIVSSLLVSCLGVLLFKPVMIYRDKKLDINLRIATLYGLSISLLSFISDVSVSLFKRNAGLKDTGSLLPGHGGVLDRIDSYILTGPAAFWFWTFFSSDFK